MAITSDDGETREYLLPRNVHINVINGERVNEMRPVDDEPSEPHGILPVLDEVTVCRT